MAAVGVGYPTGKNNLTSQTDSTLSHSFIKQYLSSFLLYMLKSLYLNILNITVPGSMSTKAASYTKTLKD